MKRYAGGAPRVRWSGLERWLVGSPNGTAGLAETLRGQFEEEARFGHGFLWLPVFASLGAAYELSASHSVPMVALALVLVACILALRASRARSPVFRAPLFVAVAFTAGMVAAQLQIMRCSTVILDGPVVTHVAGTVTKREIDENGRWRYTVALASTRDPEIRRPPETVRLFAGSRHDPIAIGAGISGLAKLLPPSGPVLPGGYDFAFHAYFNGLGAIGFFFGPPSPVSLPQKQAGIFPSDLRVDAARSLARFRETIADRIRAVVDGQAGAMATALTVADRRAVSDETATDLRASGLAHILAISGLHMVLVAGTLFFLLRGGLGFVPRLAEAVPVKKIAAVGALFTSTAYLVISGAAVSTERAWIMLAVVLCAVLLDRPALTLRNVAIAALIIIATTPSAVVGPGFQMSFAATVALIASYGAISQRVTGRQADGVRPRHSWWRSALIFVGGIAFTSLVAGFATGIFAAYHFHRVATYGLIGNLLAMPVVTLVIMPMALCALLVMPYGLEAWPLKIMGAGLDVVLAIAHRVAEFGGVVATGRLALPEMAVVVAGFVVLVLCRTRLRLLGLCVMTAGLAAMLGPLASRQPDVLVSGDGRLVALNVNGVLATNRQSPPSFVFDQWREAMATDRHRAAKRLKDTGGTGTTQTRGVDPHTAIASALASQPTGRFSCLAKEWCAARLSGISIVTVAAPANLGAACDLADLIVTPAFVHMTRCRSGAVLLTGRTLRRSGASEIYIQAPDARQTRTGPASGTAEAAETTGAGEAIMAEGTRPERTLRIVSAVAGTVRAWTIQRYYDWRSRRFIFDPSGGADP